MAKNPGWIPRDVNVVDAGAHMVCLRIPLYSEMSFAGILLSNGRERA